jgi:CheY-like chemotaxis protein
MTAAPKTNVILMADDDDDDRLLTRDAVSEAGLEGDLYFVQNGEELLDYLCRRGKYNSPASAPRPGLILLDLNMPLKDGREALREIRGDRISAPKCRWWRCR